MAEDGIINYSDLIGKDSTFEDILDNIKEIEAELLSMAEATKKAFASLSPSDSGGIAKLEKEVQKLTAAKKNLAKIESAATKAKKKNIQLTQEELVQRETEKIANRERVARAKQLAILRTSESKSIAALRAKLSLVTLDWKKLSAEELKNGREGKKLVKTKLDLTNQLKKLEKQTGDNRRNVGNYTDSLSKLGKTAARVFVGRSAIDGLRRIGAAFGDIIEKNKDTDEAIGGLSKALGSFGKSAGGLGLSILKLVAGPLTSFLKGLKSVVDFLSGADTATEEFVATGEELVGVTKQIETAFAKELATTDKLFTAIGKANKGSTERKDIIDQINTQYGKYLPNLLTEASTVLEIAAAHDILIDSLTNEFLLKKRLATQTSIFNQKANTTLSNFKLIATASKSVGVSITEGSLGAFQKLSTELSRGGVVAQAFYKLLTNRGNEKGVTETLKGMGSSAFELALKLRDAQEAGGKIFTTFKKQVTATLKFDKAIGTVNEGIASLEDATVTYREEVDETTKSTKSNTEAIKDNSSARIKALKALRDATIAAETDNIKDAQSRAIALEALRFQAENAERIKNFKELKALTTEQGGDLTEIEGLNQRLSEEQLKNHLDNKVGIIKNFENKRVSNASKTVKTAQALIQTQQEKDNALFKEDLDSKQKLVQDANAKAAIEEKAAAASAKKTKEELLNQLSATAKKVAEEITKLFEQQADLSAKSVDRQQENLTRARDKSQMGLKSNIAFEESELAARQLEQQKRDKEAAQAAKLLSLYNLVAAYAGNGDQNALFRGIADFAILETLAAGLPGFYDGTEDTGKVGSPLDNKGGRLAILHDNERVMTKAHNMALNGMSSDDVVQNALLGESMGDYFDPQSISTQSQFKKQKADFEESMKGGNSQAGGTSNMEKYLAQIDKRLASQPNIGIEIEKLYGNVYDKIKTEVKSQMTKRSKTRI